MVMVLRSKIQKAGQVCYRLKKTLLLLPHAVRFYPHFVMPAYMFENLVLYMSVYYLSLPY